MENASKALLIAAGVLFAMLVIGLLTILTTNLNLLGQAEETEKAQKQLADFNAEYEAYNKKRMYGTDVITLVNKAIENNKKLGLDEMHTSFVNVTIYVTQDFETIQIIKDEYGNEQGGRTSVGGETPKLRKNTRYSLGTTNEQMNEAIIEFFNQAVNDSVGSVVGEPDWKKYTYSALTEFKRAIFKCEEIIYENRQSEDNKYKTNSDSNILTCLKI